jgi:hypothetical protein
MGMTTNIPKASANPMAPTTQQAVGIKIASFISTASAIPMASAIPDGIQLTQPLQHDPPQFQLAHTF